MQCYLDEQNIHSRPIEGSNLARQPFMKHYSNCVEVRGDLKNADQVHDHGFFIGINKTINKTINNKMNYPKLVVLISTPLVPSKIK